MAVCAGSAIALEAVQPPVEKVEQTAGDCNAALTVAVITYYRFERIAAWKPILGNGDRA